MSTKKKSKKIQMSPDTAKAVKELKRLRKLDKAYVVLSISHKSLKPEEIDETLKLKATNSLRKGDEIYKSERFDICSPATYWSMSSEDEVTSPDVELHLEWLLGTLSGKLRAVRQLQKKNAKMKITIQMKPWSRLVATSLSVQTLNRIAELQMEMEFIIHYQNTDAEY